MKKSLLLSIGLILTVFIFKSCDFPEHYFIAKPECVSQQEGEGDANTETYQNELVELLKNKYSKEYRYFFKTFQEEADRVYMMTNFRNQEECFDVKILVDKWDKLAGMKRTNGKSYPEELYDLQWQIKKIEGKEIPCYIDMHDIID